MIPAYTHGSLRVDTRSCFILSGSKSENKKPVSVEIGRGHFDTSLMLAAGGMSIWHFRCFIGW